MYETFAYMVGVINNGMSCRPLILGSKGINLCSASKRIKINYISVLKMYSITLIGKINSSLCKIIL